MRHSKPHRESDDNIELKTQKKCVVCKEKCKEPARMVHFTKTSGLDNETLDLYVHNECLACKECKKKKVLSPTYKVGVRGPSPF